jgi:hypothetical protein
MERVEHELETTAPGDSGNRWYDYVPLVLIGIWALVVAAELLTDLMVGHGGLPPRQSREIALLFKVSNWCGVAGWLAMFGHYFVLAANKRASGWWAAAGICVGLNLPLYIALLLMRPRRIVEPVTAAELAGLTPLATNTWVRSEFVPLKDRFACTSCHALISHGASECSACGERYQYVNGKPLALED